MTGFSTVEGGVIIVGVLLFLWFVFVVASKNSIPEEWSYELLYDELTPYEFEEVVAELWEDKGYNITHKEKGADQGVDVKATKRGTSITIQVKQYNRDTNSIGSNTVRTVLGSAQHANTRRSMVVTTSRFTDPAKEVEKANSSITLISGPELVEELNESSVDPTDFEESLRS